MRKLGAILPAGGSIDREFAKVVGTTSKALIPIGGRTCLDIAIDSVRAVEGVGQIVVIGGDAVGERLTAVPGIQFLSEAKTGPDNIYMGLNALMTCPEPPEAALVVTTDQPFLSAGMIDSFVAACPPEKKICVPLIRESEFQARFPGTSATFARLRDDTWTTGGAFLLEVQAMLDTRSHVERVFENRKDKLGMARMLGLSFVLKWLTNRLTLADVERKIENLLGASGAAITGCAPELAYDIDDLEDYERALRFAPASKPAEEIAK